MSREEVEKRLAQLMGNVALTDGSGEADQRSSQEDEAISLERLEIEDQLTVDQKLEENSTVD
jgi:hypothetical protein